MTEIFVSYRREDSAGWTGRLAHDLHQEFGRSHVFHDVDTMIPGCVFPDAITLSLQRADCVLVVIGPNWLTAKDSKGKYRISDPNDYVRLEVATALRSGSPVIPVLVGGAEAPPESKLPDDIKSLSRRHAFELSDRHWHDDINRLVRAIGPTPKSFLLTVAQQFRLHPRRTIAFGLLNLGLLALLAAFFVNRFSPWGRPTPPIDTEISDSPANVRLIGGMGGVYHRLACNHDEALRGFYGSKGALFFSSV